MKTQKLAVHDVIRMPNYETAGGFRLWRVTGQHLGGTDQEGTYSLEPLDQLANETIHIPCVMLESHPLVEILADPFVVPDYIKALRNRLDKKAIVLNVQGHYEMRDLIREARTAIERLAQI